MTADRLIAKSASVTGLESALLFALVAERLEKYYEHAQWLKNGQALQLAQEWLARSKITITHERLKALVAASDDLSRQIEGSLSREAGLFTVHEMMESLDPNYQSELGQMMMEQCRDWMATRSNEDRQ